MIAEEFLGKEKERYDLLTFCMHEQMKRKLETFSTFASGLTKQHQQQ